MLMKTYLVGGAVRDKLLNYPFVEKDWVITGATVKEMLELGYQQVGKDFPVFLHPKTKDEHALARIERKSGHGYSGFEVDARPEVTLEEDLSRRDLTINAIAEDTEGNIIDPFNGVGDIEHKILRHVSNAFVEDPVRVLRLARFAARYHHLGFTIADETLNLMRTIVNDGELEHLVAERVWREMERALGEKNPEVFYEVLREVGALKVLLPEIDVLFGIPGPKKWHPEIDTGIHTMMVLVQAVKLSDLPLVRFAALCHDLGKGITPKELWPKHRGHEKAGIKIINSLCERLKIPREFRELACLGSEYHLHSHTALELKPKTLLNMMEAFDIYRRAERFEYFIDISEADSRGRTGYEDRDYPQREYLEEAMQTVLSISNKTLDDPSLSGRAIGDALRKARLQALVDLKPS
ncbi:MAG: tRNA nucleotidyltransferase (CCA-adding enzyme) [Enterobacterales bacterium]